MTVEAAPYIVLNTWTQEGIELRQYDSLRWVCTQSHGSSMDKAKKECFWKLFRYISKKNEQKTKVPMTVPVTIESKPDHISVMKRCFTMGFYIPEAFQSNPPTPVEEGVFIETRPAMKIYCCRYSGFSNDDEVMINARKLGENLDRLGLKYTPDPFYFAGYDSPFRLLNRRNEIWFKAD
ncbi:hypothetical protein MN116_007656 [Schistosoma mekongi]|uniref:Heme-binding protein 1 n=1 Tax=Schistosoma mekongi TaxID=38744 RepID=A0AAE1Z6E8_SCHME|nr:hypothetical protein MN116_007656 [Schistosoma mekongi]